MMLKKVALPEQRIVGFNFFHPAVASSDEREHAKKVATACQVDVDYINLQDYAYLNFQTVERFDKPSSFLLDLGWNKEMARRIQSYGDLEIMCGQGGDHLFMAPPPVESIADYLILQGFRGITPKIKDISAYYRMPLLSVLSKNLSSFVHYKRGNLKHIELLYEPTNWMNQSFKEKLNKDIFQVPFWHKLKNLPPAKVQHIFALYQATLYIDRGHRIAHKPVINPLLSQPLVELALAVPTYQLYGNGYDRVQFRKAMYQFTKHDYIWRKTKGETSGIFMIAFNRQIKEITDIS